MALTKKHVGNGNYIVQNDGKGPTLHKGTRDDCDAFIAGREKRQQRSDVLRVVDQVAPRKRALVKPYVTGIPGSGWPIVSK